LFEPVKSMETIQLSIERAGRGGKTVTLLTGFTHDLHSITELARKIKLKCGTGGAVKGRSIEIQGDFRERIRRFLSDEGYGVKG
jgi:translation initiation factor 1